MDLNGQVALVTGGGRGIGRGITERLLAAGAEVVVCGRNHPGEPPSADGRAAVFHRTDVRDPEQVRDLVSYVERSFGRLDLLVNNAGGSPRADAATASPRFSRAVLDLNLLGPLHCAQAAYAVMRRQPEGGSIVNIGSVSGTRPSPGTAVYGAAKAGLASLTRSLAAEWAPRVRVNCLVVGLVLTDQSHDHYGDAAAQAGIGAAIPLGRLASVDEIAGPVLFLASHDARYVTGAELAVHGGGERPTHLQATESRPDHPSVN
ncbi:SDR family oxidoreductase [Wenjunlia tyrosinilytica]|jgi:NAD(P)-dependent dehydrogenase (short-subunit alcohol dehydrogenase family)|uniref:Short-chain dehydrogenase/reductase n=1 Tax=Wenjunlia tyrosinilytica TaxID=1544741 RepID=A0A917ZMT7_9ACTN|nr:SDR family oxidoreductase [Wenjunlia tyrosinilytica]GGO86755.1 putative short-chain dehydrogenase/reductase [Wenjunlia tyrosinilytica]